jgi:hypothetical protein
MLHACFDCIYYKEPNLVHNVRRFTDISYCLKHKDYAELSRENPQKCGLYGKDFSPRFRKINQNKIEK